MMRGNRAIPSGICQLEYRRRRGVPTGKNGRHQFNDSPIAFGAACDSLPILCRTQTDLPRPFRMPFATLICLAGVPSCLILLSTTTAHNWLLMVGTSLLGFASYFLYGFRHSKLAREHRGGARQQGGD